MTAGSRLGRVMIERGGALVLVAFAITVWLTPEHIPDTEAAEFSLLGSQGGVGHPPGYPLYLIYLRLTSWLPGATTAQTAAIATAILGAVQLLVLHAACRAWGARPLAATMAVAIYAAAPLVLRYHSQAEVFALNGLVVATVLWLSANAGPLRGQLRVIALALVAGLGISNHHTCVMVAPIGLFGLVVGLREIDSRAARVRAGLLGIAALAVGLLPYTYLLATADNRGAWGPVDDLGGLLRHFMREDYGGAGTFFPGGGEAQPVANLLALGMTLGRAWLWLPLLGGLAMLTFRAWRSPDGATWAWRMLALSWVLCGPLLVVQFNVDPKRMYLYITERFHLVAILVLVIPVAFAADWLGRRLAPHAVNLARPVVLTVLAVVLHVVLVVVAALRLDQLRSPALERSIANLVESMPPDAVVFASGDSSHSVVTYLGLAERVRPDVTVVNWQLTSYPWYRARLVSRGIVFAEPFDPSMVGAVSALLDARRPVFVDATVGKVLDKFQNYPYGYAIRIVPPGEASPPVEEVFAINKRLLEGFRLDYPIPGPDDYHATVYQNNFVFMWRTLGDALSKDHPEEAAWAYAAADTLSPK